MTNEAPPPRRTEVVVVGAGAIGLAIALELAKRGREVVVLERDALGVGASAGNAGFVVPSHVIPVAEPGMVGNALKAIVGRGAVRLRFRPGLLGWGVAFLRHCNRRAVQAAAPVLASLAERSAALYRELAEGGGIDCGLQAGGLLHVYRSGKALAEAERHAGWEATFGVRSEVLRRAEAHAAEPALKETVAGAIHYPNDAGLNPRRLVESLAAALARRGVVVASRTEVRGVRERGGLARSLATSQGDIQVEQAVIAAGAGTPRLAAKLGVRLPIQPAKGYSVTVRRPAQGPRRRMLLGEAKVAVAPQSDRLRFAGWFELGRGDLRLPPARLAWLERSARASLRLDADLSVVERWAGLRPVTPDGLPVIGRSRACRNVVYAAGHAMLGITLAPATGRLTAQLLCDEPSDQPLAPFSAERFG